MWRKGISWTLAILVVLGAAVVLIFMTRCDVSAQEEGAVAERLIATARANLRAYGIYMDYKPHGVVEQIEDTLDLLVDAEESFFFVENGERVVRSLGDLLAERPDARPYLRDVMSEGLRVGDRLYRVHFANVQSYVTISPDGRAYSGALPKLSRLPVGTYYPVQPSRYPEGSTIAREICAEKLISHNIFGQPAERIEACVRAHCRRPIVDSCELVRIEAKSWFFGAVVADPEYAPIAGTVYRSYCRGPVRYKWGVGLGPIRITKYGEFEIKNYRMGGQSTIMPELSCE